MSREEVVRLAKEAGLSSPQQVLGNDFWTADESDLIRFAALVAQAEREACARVCDEKARRNFPWGSESADIYHAQADWAELCAAAIRARNGSDA